MGADYSAALESVSLGPDRRFPPGVIQVPGTSQGAVTLRARQWQLVPCRWGELLPLSVVTRECAGIAIDWVTGGSSWRGLLVILVISGA